MIKLAHMAPMTALLIVALTGGAQAQSLEGHDPRIQRLLRLLQQPAETKVKNLADSTTIKGTIRIDVTFTNTSKVASPIMCEPNVLNPGQDSTNESNGNFGDLAATDGTQWSCSPSITYNWTVPSDLNPNTMIVGDILVQAVTNDFSGHPRGKVWANKFYSFAFPFGTLRPNRITVITLDGQVL